MSKAVTYSSFEYCYKGNVIYCEFAVVRVRSEAKRGASFKLSAPDGRSLHVLGRCDAVLLANRAGAPWPPPRVFLAVFAVVATSTRNTTGELGRRRWMATPARCFRCLRLRRAKLVRQRAWLSAIEIHWFLHWCKCWSAYHVVCVEEGIRRLGTTPDIANQASLEANCRSSRDESTQRLTRA